MGSSSSSESGRRKGRGSSRQHKHRGSSRRHKRHGGGRKHRGGCHTCGKRVRDGIRYCDCGHCNECHEGGWCPTGGFWYHKKGTPGKRRRIIPGSSHGGHRWHPTIHD